MGLRHAPSLVTIVSFSIAFLMRLRAPSLALPVLVLGILWAPVNSGALRKVVIATPLGLIQHAGTRCNDVASRYGTANSWAIVANPPPRYHHMGGWPILL